MFSSGKRYRITSLATLVFFLVQIFGVPAGHAYHVYNAGNFGTSFGPSAGPGFSAMGFFPGINGAFGGDPVELSTGAFTHAQKELSISLGMRSFDITRSYNSHSVQNGRYGFGWTFNFNMKLKKEHNNNILLLDGTGRTHEYIWEDSSGLYRTPKDRTDELAENEGNGTCELRDRYANTYLFDQDGCLQSVSDRFDNHISFFYAQGKRSITGRSDYFVSQNSGVIAQDHKLATIIDSSNRVVTLTYYDDGRLYQIIDHGLDGLDYGESRAITYKYDAEGYGHLTEVEYPDGRVLQYRYGEGYQSGSVNFHKITGMVNGRGTAYLTNYYDDKGRVCKQIHDGDTYEFLYECSFDCWPKANRTTAINPRGVSTVWTFNGNGNPAEKKTFLLPWSVRKNTEGKCEVFKQKSTALWDGQSDICHTEKYEYQDSRHPFSLTRVELPDSTSVGYQYDDSANLTEKRVIPAGASQSDPGAHIVTLMNYDSATNGIRNIVGPLGESTFEHGDTTRITTSSTPNPIEVVFLPDGRIDRFKDQMGRSVSFGYYESYGPDGVNCRGMISEITADNGPGTATHATKILKYANYGQVQEIEDELGRKASFTYYQNNLLHTVTKGASSAVFTYDRDRNLESLTITDSKIIGKRYFRRFSHDSMDRVTGIDVDSVERNGNELTIVYDDSLGTVTQTDGRGHDVTYQYDEFGRLKAAQSGQKVVQYAKGRDGKVDSIDVFDGAKAVFGISDDYRYDSIIGRFVKSVTYGSQTGCETKKIPLSYSYDKAGRPVSRTDSKGTTEYRYNSLNQPAKIIFPDRSETNYTYTADGQVETATNSEVSYTFRYYSSGRLKEVLDSRFSGGPTITREYDDGRNQVTTILPAFNRKTAVISDPGGRQVTKVIDYPNASSPTANVVSYGYSDFGRQDYRKTYFSIDPASDLALRVPDISSSTWYDSRGRTACIENNLPNGKIRAYAYGYDNNDNNTIKIELDETRKSVIDGITTGQCSSLNIISGYLLKEVQGYDGSDQLKDYTRNETKKTEYFYDAAGNRDYVYVKENGVTVADYDYSANCVNQYETVAGQGESAALGYDPDGNLKTRTYSKAAEKSRKYTYNDRNQLVAVRDKNDHVIAAYAYDPFGRRIKKVAGTGTTDYIYDGDHVVAEINGNRQLQAYYVYGARPDETVSMERDGSKHLYLQDGTGNTTYLLNSSGAVEEKYVYDPYGNIDNAGARGNPHLFAGRMYDAETGLHYFRARYYDASIGRFTQPDPLGYEAGDENLYRYVFNNPLRYADPHGLCAVQGGLLDQIGWFLGQIGTGLAEGVGTGYLGAMAAVAIAELLAVSGLVAISPFGVGLVIAGLFIGAAIVDKMVRQDAGFGEAVLNTLGGIVGSLATPRGIGRVVGGCLGGLWAGQTISLMSDAAGGSPWTGAMPAASTGGSETFDINPGPGSDSAGPDIQNPSSMQGNTGGGGGSDIPDNKIPLVNPGKQDSPTNPWYNHPPDGQVKTTDAWHPGFTEVQTMDWGISGEVTIHDSKGEVVANCRWVVAEERPGQVYIVSIENTSSAPGFTQYLFDSKFPQYYPPDTSFLGQIGDENYRTFMASNHNAVRIPEPHGYKLFAGIKPDSGKPFFHMVPDDIAAGGPPVPWVRPVWGGVKPGNAPNYVDNPRTSSLRFEMRKYAADNMDLYLPVFDDKAPEDRAESFWRKAA
ncbi:MAG: RHS repeat-associated core domain-containing protein [Pseudomonadota bacterium]